MIGVFVDVAVGVDVFVEPEGGVFVEMAVLVAGAVAVFVEPGRGVFVDVAVAVFVAPGTTVLVEVAVLVGRVTQVGPEMMFDCSVTAPVWARRRPFIDAPVLRLIEARARMLPLKLVPTSSVADEPTRHQTLQGSPPVTEEPGEVMSVSEDLKIQTPEPLRVRFPVSENATAQ
jgi:hypothetical protein